MPPHNKRDYYDVLGITRGASEQDIKSAFRRLAKDCHPDRNASDKGAEQKFKELNEAYEALKDPQKRAAYDQFGHVDHQNPAFAPTPLSTLRRARLCPPRRRLVGRLDDERHPPSL